MILDLIFFKTPLLKSCLIHLIFLFFKFLLILFSVLYIANTLFFFEKNFTKSAPYTVNCNYHLRNFLIFASDIIRYAVCRSSGFIISELAYLKPTPSAIFLFYLPFGSIVAKPCLKEARKSTSP